MSGVSGPRGRSRSAYLQALQRLSARDHVLMQLLHEHATLTSPQITSMLFATTDSARGRLARLRRQGWITNFHTQRAGRRLPEHWVLDQWGSRWAAFAADEPEPTPRAVRTRNEKIAASSQLEHTDGIHDFFVALIAAGRRIPTHQPGQAGPTSAARVARWWSAARTAREVGAHVHPDGHGVWEHTPAPTTSLAAAPAAAPGDQPPYAREGSAGAGADRVQVGFYLEYDRGTESLRQLADKLGPYRKFCADGHGPHWPVLIVVPTRAREGHLHEHVRRLRESNPRWPASPDPLAPHPYGLPTPQLAWRQDQATSPAGSGGAALVVLTTSCEQITTAPLGPADQLWQPLDGFEPRTDPATASPVRPDTSPATLQRIGLCDLTPSTSSQRLWDPGPPGPHEDPLFGLPGR